MSTPTPPERAPDQVVMHINQQHGKTEWKYSVEIIMGDSPNNRKVIKVRGDDIEKVKSEIEALKSFVNT